MKRTLSIPAVVLVAVVALVLGTFGSATAAGITKGTVKKIAAKVVDKKAPSLSVAKAATATKADTATTAITATSAGNASTVGGKSAAQLQTNGYRLALPAVGAATSQDFSFPGIPAGTYQFSYSLTAQMSTSGSILICQFRSAPASGVDAVDYGGSFSSFSRAASSAIVTVASGSELNCNTSGGTAAILGGTNTGSVSFVPVDAVTAGTATGARAAGDARGAGPTG